MSKLRHSLAAFGLFTAALMGASQAANATVSYNDVGFGNLSGYNPFNILDGQTAGLTVNLAESNGLVTTDIVAESLNGHAFTLNQRGSQIGDGSSYIAGFTFNLGVPSYIQYVPSTPGQNWTWTVGAPTLSGGVVTAGTQIGAANASHFANLAAGKYTLLFTGVVDLAPGESTSFGGDISTVPLPGSLVMFGSALIGLTAFGARRRTGLSA